MNKPGMRWHGAPKAQLRQQEHHPKSLLHASSPELVRQRCPLIRQLPCEARVLALICPVDEIAISAGMRHPDQIVSGV
jgi:hypothetical protein